MAIPIIGLSGLIVDHGLLHFFGGEGVVSGTKVEAQLIHRTRFHLDIIGKHDGESLPLVGIRIVDGKTHFLFQTTRLTHTVSLVKFVVLQERKDVVVENTNNPQCHCVEANGVEIHGGLVHIGNDDAIIGPAHFGQVVSQVEIKLIVALQHHAIVGTNATLHGHLQFRKLVSIQGRLVEIEINLIPLNVSLIAKFFVEIHITRKVLVLLQGL